MTNNNNNKLEPSEAMKWLYYTSNSNHEHESKNPDEPQLLKVEKLDSVSIINGIEHEQEFHDDEEGTFNDLDMDMFKVNRHIHHRKGNAKFHHTEWGKNV